MPRNLGAYGDGNDVPRKSDVDERCPSILSIGSRSPEPFTPYKDWYMVMQDELSGTYSRYYMNNLPYDIRSRIPLATPIASGTISPADRVKLDGIAANANNYSHPTTAGNKHIPPGGSSGQTLKWSADGEAEWGYDIDTLTTTEQETGSKWIDGKTIYRKVIVKTGGLPSAAGSTTIAHGILYDGANDIDTVVSLSGEGYLASSSMWLPLPYMSATETQAIALRAHGVNIEFIVGMNRSGVTPCYVTIEYTRASDVAS